MRWCLKSCCIGSRLHLLLEDCRGGLVLLWLWRLHGRIGLIEWLQNVRIWLFKLGQRFIENVRYGIYPLSLSLTDLPVPVVSGDVQLVFIILEDEGKFG